MDNIAGEQKSLYDRANGKLHCCQEVPAWTDCPVGASFGTHGGQQHRSPRYFKCGCDAGNCANHARMRGIGGPSWEPGIPRRCEKHQ